jgi:hypothetical protein
MAWNLKGQAKRRNSRMMVKYKGDDKRNYGLKWRKADTILKPAYTQKQKHITTYINIQIDKQNIYKH